MIDKNELSKTDSIKLHYEKPDFEVIKLNLNERTFMAASAGASE